MQVCCRCSSKLVGTFFELIHDARSKVNDHFVCAECFGFLHAKRGCQPWFECPDCSLQITGHYVWKKTVLSSTRRKATLSQAEERQLPAVFTNGATSIQLDPCRYFKAQDQAFKLDNSVVSMQWFDSGCGQTRSLALVLPKDINADMYDDATKDGLIDFMALLYPVFFLPESDRGRLPVLSTLQDIDSFVLADKSILTDALVAFALGGRAEEMLPNFNGGNQAQMNNYLGFWAAAELLRRNQSWRPGPLQDILQHHMTIHQCPVAVRDALTKF